MSLAGLFLFGVALLPTGAPDWPPPFSENWKMPIAHGVCAVAFFALIAVVCIFARSHGLQKEAAPLGTYNREYARYYNVAASLMIGIIVVAFVVLVSFRRFPGTSLFWIETAAIWVFAWYWHLN